MVDRTPQRDLDFAFLKLNNPNGITFHLNIAIKIPGDKHEVYASRQYVPKYAYRRLSSINQCHHYSLHQHLFFEAGRDCFVGHCLVLIFFCGKYETTSWTGSKTRDGKGKCTFSSSSYITRCILVNENMVTEVGNEQDAPARKKKSHCEVQTDRQHLVLNG